MTTVFPHYSVRSALNFTWKYKPFEMRVSLVAIQVFLVGHFKGKSTLYKSTGWRLTFFSVPIRLSLWRTGKMNQHWRNLFAWVASCCSILTLHRGKRQSTILLPFKKSETDFNSQFRDFEVRCQNRIFPLKLFLRFFFAENTLRKTIIASALISVCF